MADSRPEDEQETERQEQTATTDERIRALEERVGKLEAAVNGSRENAIDPDAEKDNQGEPGR